MTYSEFIYTIYISPLLSDDQMKGLSNSERELALKLVTLRRCKYYKWDVWGKLNTVKIERITYWRFGRESFVGMECENTLTYF